MKRLQIAVVIAFLFLCPKLAQGQAQPETSCDPEKPNDQCVSAAQVGVDVQRALQLANLAGLSGLTLDKAVLTLETAATTKGGIDINFLIFTLKHTAKKGNTVTQTITWGTLDKPAGGGTTADLKDVLASAVATAAQITSKVTAIKLSQAVIKIQFVVDKETSGSISYKILGVTLGPSIDVDKTCTNTLEVTFKKPAAH